MYSIYLSDWQFERQVRYADRQDALHDAALSYTAAQNLGAPGVADYANMVAWLLFGQAQGRLGNVQGALMAYRRHIALAEATDRFHPTGGHHVCRGARPDHRH
ncbi:MAG: hypothetical protein IPK19_18790 [Chloroflexi bacterium]|nr:hypothetical protein [Chloroflexota bacterium]